MLPLATVFVTTRVLHDPQTMHAAVVPLAFVVVPQYELVRAAPMHLTLGYQQKQNPEQFNQLSMEWQGQWKCATFLTTVVLQCERRWFGEETIVMQFKRARWSGPIIHSFRILIGQNITRFTTLFRDK